MKFGKSQKVSGFGSNLLVIASILFGNTGKTTYSVTEKITQSGCALRRY